MAAADRSRRPLGRVSELVTSHAQECQEKLTDMAGCPPAEADAMGGAESSILGWLLEKALTGPQAAGALLSQKVRTTGPIPPIPYTHK